MSKKSAVFLIVFAILLGYFIGHNLEGFSSKSASLPPTYSPRVPSSLSEEGMAFSDVVKSLSPTVVNISTSKTRKRDLSPLFDGPFGDFFEHFNIPRKWKEQSLGSGVIVSSDGYIVTNSHVVEKADEIKVTLYNRQDYKGEIIGSDPKTDIAIIKIKSKDLPAITWGDSDKLEVGAFVLAFGNPYGFSHTVTMGIVSAVGRANVGIADYEDFIQTDAAINPGNSGGPLVNIRGELVGINTAIFSRTGGYQGIGFAVPANMARLVMKQIVDEGKVTRGWLGVSIQSVTPELAEGFDLANVSGALVSEVFKGSPAEKAGLKRGDVILKVNGREIRDTGSLRNAVSQSEVGSVIKLKVMRDGKAIVLEATVSEIPKEMAEVSSEGGDEAVTEENSLAGFSVTDLTPGIAKQLGLPREEKGVVIVRVEPYSEADGAELKKGDVIQEMDKERILNLRDFNNIASDIKPGRTVLLFVNRGGKKFYVTLKILS